MSVLPKFDSMGFEPGRVVVLTMTVPLAWDRVQWEGLREAAAKIEADLTARGCPCICVLLPEGATLRTVDGDALDARIEAVVARMLEEAATTSAFKMPSEG